MTLAAFAPIPMNTCMNWVALRLTNEASYGEAPFSSPRPNSTYLSPLSLPTGSTRQILFVDQKAGSKNLRRNHGQIILTENRAHFGNQIN